MNESVEISGEISAKDGNVSRRDALKLFGLGLAAATGVFYKREEIVGVIDSMGEAAVSSDIFDFNHPAERDLHDLSNLAYIEGLSPSPRPPFLAFENGHKGYLRNVVLNSPSIRRNIGISLNRMLHSSDENPLLGDLFEEHLLLARNALEESIPEFERMRADMQFYQAFSMATYSLTAILGAWITIPELKQMGVKFPSKYEYVDKFGISPTYQLWKLFPRIFPVELTNGIPEDSYAGLFFASGTDRSVHLMNHFFLVSRYIALLYSGNQDAERIPEFTKVLLKPFSGMMRAKALSVIAGLGWEFKETIKDKSVVGNFEKQPGFVDPVVKLDLKANRAGADLALEALSYISRSKEMNFEELLGGIRGIFAKLEDPYYREPTGLLKKIPIIDWYYTEGI